MRIGTKSLLFGVHQFAIHPWFVAWAWWRLYGFPWDPRLWVAFLVHDWGYWGKPNMDSQEGERHTELGALIMHWLFDRPKYYRWKTPSGVWKREHQLRWLHFCLFHSRFYAKKGGFTYSRLCVADKLAIALQPWWFYIPVAWLTGELREYMEGKGARTPARGRTPMQWYRDVQRYCQEWAYEHRDGKTDVWTGTKRDFCVGRPWLLKCDSSSDSSSDSAS